MDLARVLSANYPYRTMVPTYDVVAEGELCMRHGSWAAANKYYITAYANANTGSEDSLGITLASAADSYASKENAKLYNFEAATGVRGLDDGGNFQECIVNPDATYFAFYDQADAKSCTTAITASTTWTITSLEDNIDAGWLYTTDTADSAATYPGKLRYGAASASGALTAGNAVTVDTSTDFIKVLPIGHRLTGLNAAATGMTTTIAAEDGIFLDIRENYITHAASPRRPLRFWEQGGLDGLSDVTIEAEIIQLRHCYRAVVA